MRCRCRCPCRPLVAWSVGFAAGLLLLVLGFVFAYAAFPAIIDSQVANELTLWESDTEGRKNFVSAPTFFAGVPNLR